MGRAKQILHQQTHHFPLFLSKNNFAQSNFYTKSKFWCFCVVWWNNIFLKRICATGNFIKIFKIILIFKIGQRIDTKEKRSRTPHQSNFLGRAKQILRKQNHHLPLFLSPYLANPVLPSPCWHSRRRTGWSNDWPPH